MVGQLLGNLPRVGVGLRLSMCWMAQEINDRLEFPPIGVAKSGTALRFARVGAGEFDGAFELPQRARGRKGGAEEIDRGATEPRGGSRLVGLAPQPWARRKAPTSVRPAR